MMGFDKWKDELSFFYYVGAGVIMIGTGIRFLYRFFRGYDADRDFIAELKEIHLPRIDERLDQIQLTLAELDSTTPSHKTPPEE